MANNQTHVINVANELIALGQQLKAIYDSYNIVALQWNDDTIATLLNNQTTGSVNADGSVGAADGSPNVTHPITNAQLLKALSANQITSVKTILDGFKQMVDGSAVSANGAARAILSATVG